MKRQRSIPGPSFHAATAAAAAAIFLLLSAPSLATELSRVRVSQRSTRSTDSAPKVHDATLKNLHSLMRQTQVTTPETNNESDVKSSKNPKSTEKAIEKGTKKSKHPTVSKPEKGTEIPKVAPKKAKHPTVSKPEKGTKIPKTASKKESKHPKVPTLATQFTASTKSKKVSKS